MYLRLLCAAGVLAVCVPCFADPVPLAPGGVVTFGPTVGASSYSGTAISPISGANGNGTGKVTYTDTVYADPNNPLCAGCYDFVVQLQNTNTIANNGNARFATSMSTSNFKGYTIDVGYEALDQGTGSDASQYVAPTDATRNDGGGMISFDFAAAPGQSTDPLIIFTNAMGSNANGSLSITTTLLVADPPANQPSGGPVSVTPEPSSLMLLGTGALGMLGVARRRFARS